MSLSNILQPNEYELYCKNLTSPEFVKTNSIDTTDPQRLLIGDNTSTFEGIDFGTLGSVATYTFNGIPFVPGSSGATTIGPPVDAVDNNVLQISGTTINAEFASITRPGVVSATTQTFLGNKTISGNLAANNLSGTNTGDVTLTTVGVVPNANSASLVGQALTLQPADASHPGIVSAVAQSFLGDKTIVGNIAANNLSGSNTGDVTLTAIGSTANADGASLSGQALTLQPASFSFGGVVTTGTQAFNGSKTFQNPVTSTSFIIPTTTTLNNGTIQQAGSSLLHSFGTNNTMVGPGAGNFANTGAGNVACGNLALFSVNTGSGNSCFGYNSGFRIDNGNNNTLLGSVAGGIMTSGSSNVCIGQNAALSATTLTNSIIIGKGSAPTLTNQTNVIEISDGTIGATPSHGINIGMAGTNNCQIKGIAGVYPGSPDGMVIIDSTTNQLGSIDFSMTTTNYTPTLDSGSIISSTVRGNVGNIIPINPNKLSNMIIIVIPSFVVTAQSGAAATINLTGIASLDSNYWPSFDLYFPCVVQNGVGFVSGIVYLNTGGLLTLQLLDGTNFIAPFGFPYDITISYAITP